MFVKKCFHYTVRIMVTDYELRKWFDYELKVKIFPSSHEQTQKAANFSWVVKRCDCVCATIERG